jgi:hypothetical protein
VDFRRCLDRDRTGSAAAYETILGAEPLVTAAEDHELSHSWKIKSMNRWASAALALHNPLAGLDQLLHGSDDLRGWGNAAYPDPILYTVTGFDSTSNRFLYKVNPRFGSNSSSSTLRRTPFRVTLDVSIDLAKPYGEQQLERWIRPGRGGYPGKKLTSAEMKKRYERNVPDPYAILLAERDSLLLSPKQVEAIEKAQRAYRMRMDSLWTTLTDYLSALPDAFNAAEVLRRQEDAIDAGWEISRQDAQRMFPTLLTPIQLRILPSYARIYIQADKPIKGTRIWYSN